MKPGFLYQLISAFGSQKAVPRLAEPFGAGASKEEVERLLARLKRPREASCPIYTKEDRDAVWHKGQPIIGWDPEDWRVDHRGSALFREAYGDSSSAFGWEIGHIVAPAQGGLEVLSNWRPQLIRDNRLVAARLTDALDADSGTLTARK
jgi:hypothetical protein